MTGVGRDDVVQLFERSFGRRPHVIVSAPARVNLIGEHTDYNGGDVLPMGLALRTWVAAGRSTSHRSRAVSTLEQGAAEFEPRSPVRADSWVDYLAGTTKELLALGADPGPLDFAVASDVPAGAGLSSSAALEVATAGAIASLAGADIEPEALAYASHKAENAFVGVASGIMDQFASALARSGHALHLACDTITYRFVPFAAQVLVFDTAVPRSLRESAFNTRRAECEAALQGIQLVAPETRSLARATWDALREAKLLPVLEQRARHVIGETERVARFVRRLQADGMVDGEVLYASHESLRVDYECSTKELDWFVERARDADGVIGARLTGAGWGGCAIAVGDGNAMEAFARSAEPAYERTFGRRPRHWLSAAAGGLEVEG